MIIIALLGVIFATSFNLDNISVAGSLGFLIVFSLVNYANFKLYKETGGNRLISGGGTLLGLTATGVLIGHTLIHSPKSLITSGIVILAVSVFSFTYYHLKEKRLSLYMDKDLEKDELHN